MYIDKKIGNIVMTLVSEHPDKGYGHGHVKALFLLEDNTEDHLRLLGTSDSIVNGHMIDDLVVDAWYSKEYPELNWDIRAIEYHGTRKVDIEKAKAMVATSTKINKYLDKESAKLGQPETFSDLLKRVYRALGCSSMKAYRGKHWNNDGCWESLNNDSIMYWIKNEMAKNLK